MTRVLGNRTAADTPLRLLDKAALAAEVIVAYARVRRLTSRMSLPAVLEALRSTSSALVPGESTDPVHVGRRLGRVTARTLSVIPADTRCLHRSLTLTALLARRGLESSLVIAVRPGETFGAHAWLEHLGEPLLPPADAGYETLVSL